MIARDRRRSLLQQLEVARSRGMLGPGPVEAHLEHAAQMADAIGPDFSGHFLDLGSGGGVPGLVLLEVWPLATGFLLDARRRRCRFLEGALRELDLLARASVGWGRAGEGDVRPGGRPWFRRPRDDGRVRGGFSRPGWAAGGE